MIPDEPEPLQIGAALRGQRILVTGATGFLGKVLVEKLLWSVPEVGKLLLLVRARDGRDAARRLREELLESPIMSRLRALHAGDWESWAASKLEVVAGDLGRERFGLDAGAWADLAGRVDRVVGCAATVTFDERLDRALALNVHGARRTLELARDAGAAPLLHVSTCFVSGRQRGSIAERVLGDSEPAGGGLDLEDTLSALEETCRRQPGAGAGALVAAGAKAARAHGFHDVYTLTKALAERLLARDRGGVPLAIVRPAIIESAIAEPIPGWIDAVRVADPLLVAYGRGRTRELPGRPGQRLDVVPVDLVVSAMIAALAELPGRDRRAAGRGTAARASAAPEQAAPANRTAASTAWAGEPIRVYQVGSERNPLSLGELLLYAREGFARAPLRDDRSEPIRLPAPRFVQPRRYRRKLEARRRRLGRLAGWLGSTRLARRLATGERTLGHLLRLLDVYGPYLEHAARYEDGATRALWGRLSTADRAAFPFDVAGLDWRAYVANVHVPGVVRFALRAEDGAPPPPRKDDPMAAAHSRGEFPAAAATHLFGLLAAAAAADPGTVAFQTCRQGRWLRYTYGQALTATANVAARLRRLGVGRGDRVVLWGGASPEWVLTSFAVHRLGAVTVPLDPQWPAEEITQAAAFTGAKLICAAPPLAAKLAARRDAAPAVVELAEPFVPAPEVGLLPGAEEVDGEPGAGDPAAILFTSGTTVAPKAVPLTHGNLLANVRDLVPVMRSSRERLLSVLPIHHVFEFTVGLLVPLAGGGTISYLAELKPAEISWMMGATRPTMLVAVPRLLELLHNGIRQSVAAGGPALRALFRLLFALSAATGGRLGRRLFGKVHRRFGGCLRRIATGGSALEPGLGRSFKLMGFEVAEGYGMTETSPVLTVNPWGAIRFGSVGRPLPGVEIEVRPAEGAVNGAGEIWVRGANVMAGYYRNPEATRAAMADGWLDTGDVGFFDAGGYLRIAGRSKDVIVTDAGKNVYPEEVELRYRGLPGVEELVVLGLQARGRGEVVGAVVVPRAGATDEEIEAIREAVAARAASVPSYQQIARLEIWRGELPKTTTMKVKRGLLREAVLAGERGGGAPPAPAKPAAATPAAAASVRPAGEAERWVIATLARLTRTRPELLGAGDRLAELGVDSLTRVELLADMESRFAITVDDETAGAVQRVRDLFELVAAEPRRRAERPLAGSASTTRLSRPPAA